MSLDMGVGHMERTTLTIEGMHCGHCVTAVSDALKAMSGVEVEQVAIGSAVVQYDAQRHTTDDLVTAIADIGYSAWVEELTG
jgi:copper chaperone CopZ